MSAAPAVESSRGGPLHRFLRGAVEVKEDEVGTMLMACLYFFFILASWFIMRPIREQMGVAGGTRNLPWLYTGTLVATLLVHPPFAALVARLPRRTFITISNRFFLVNIVAFYLVLRSLGEADMVWAGRVFFIWTSVFNLFVVSVFWAFMVDVFSTDQAKRLFGFIGLGGTLGGLVGSFLTSQLAERIGPLQLLLISAVFLELAVQCVHRISALRNARPNQPPEQVIGGTTLAGVSHVLKSPYLLAICVYMLLFTVGSTVLYFQQAEIAKANFTDRASQTAFFANLDLAVNILTLATQAFLTGRLIRSLGVGVTLAFLPAISILGFAGLGAVPVLAVFVAFQVLRRAGEYAVARPSREVLYTVLDREDKYKAKHFIDTFIYRGGDQVGAWSMAGLGALGLGLKGTAWAAVPIAALWLAISIWLGRRQQAIAGPAKAA